MRVGIFGGAFDPPHLGHEKAAKTFLESAALDILYVIPSGDPPHKTILSGSRGEDRMKMAKLAFSPLSKKIQVSDLELLSEKKSYSYLTVQEIKRRHPEDEIYLFVGTDQFLAFETWREFQYLLSSCVLCVMDRFEDKSVLLEKKERLEKEFGARCLIFEEKPYIISSTQIREDMGKKGFSEALSPKVNEYIAVKNLYNAVGYPLRKKALDRAVETLSEERLSHTLSVEREVMRLSDLFSLSKKEKEDLSLAALYHDLTKNWSVEEQKSFLEERGEVLSREDMLSPAVLHGRSASFLAEEEWGLEKEILDAISFHTTGKEKMTLKEKILFYADYIEELRRHAVCREEREYFYKNLPENKEEREVFLDSCIIRVLEKTISHLNEKNAAIHPLTLRALGDLKEISERKGL